jgi:hypothetical protein
MNFKITGYDLIIPSPPLTFIYPFKYPGVSLSTLVSTCAPVPPCPPYLGEAQGFGLYPRGGRRFWLLGEF